MTIIPQPAQKPLRLLEIVAGLICLAAGSWMLTQFAIRLFGSAPQMEIRSTTDSALLLVQAIYLVGFGGNLLRRGYVGLLFWVIAAAILVALPSSAGWLG